MRFYRRQLLRTLSICFRVELILGRNQLGLVAQNSHTAKGLSSRCGGGCYRSGDGKSDGNRRAVLPSARSKRWGVGTSSTWESRSTGNPFGSKRQAPRLFTPFPRRATISGMPKRSGW